MTIDFERFFEGWCLAGGMFLTVLIPFLLVVVICEGLTERFRKKQKRKETSRG